MWLFDRARRQYGLPEDYEIPEHMSRDPPEYQPSEEYAPSPAPAPTPISTENNEDLIIAEPIDNDVIIAESSEAIPYSVYRKLRLKQDELQEQIDKCMSQKEEMNKDLKGLAEKLKIISSKQRERIKQKSQNPILAQSKNTLNQKIRITSIEYVKGWEIDKIIFNFNNGKSKEYGGEGGSNKNKIILDKDEKIVKIEQYYNGWHLGKKMIFYTNKREIIIEGELDKGVKVRGMKSFYIEDQKELFGLNFERGILIGIDQNGGSIRRKKRKSRKKLSTRKKKIKSKKTKKNKKKTRK